MNIKEDHAEFGLCREGRFVHAWRWNYEVFWCLILMPSGERVFIFFFSFHVLSFPHYKAVCIKLLMIPLYTPLCAKLNYRPTLRLRLFSFPAWPLACCASQFIFLHVVSSCYVLLFSYFFSVYLCFHSSHGFLLTFHLQIMTVGVNCTSDAYPGKLVAENDFSISVLVSY